MDEGPDIYTFIGIAIIIACVFIFSNADTKRFLLGIVGLDLKKSSYERMKQNEFEKQCLKALTNAVKMHDVSANNELQFLSHLESILFQASDRTIGMEFLQVECQYANFADTVVLRCYRDCKKSNSKINFQNCDFTNKAHQLRYVKLLWETYQYPWP